MDVFSLTNEINRLLKEIDRLLSKGMLRKTDVLKTSIFKVGSSNSLDIVEFFRLFCCN